MERLRIQKSAGVQGDRTFDFLAANVAAERDERIQLDALNGEQRYVARGILAGGRSVMLHTCMTIDRFCQLTSQQLAMFDSSEELVTERDEDIQRIGAKSAKLLNVRCG